MYGTGHIRAAGSESGSGSRWQPLLPAGNPLPGPELGSMVSQIFHQNENRVGSATQRRMRGKTTVIYRGRPHIRSEGHTTID